MALDQPRTLPSGFRTFLPGEVADFVDAMERLDDRLCLAQRQADHPLGPGWSIFRNPEDGSPPVPIAHGRPGARLGPGVLQRLAENDSRRHGNLADKIIKANEKRVADVNAKAEEDKMVAYDKMLSKAWRGHVPSNVDDLDIGR